jgi:hypothetical protein
VAEARQALDRLQAIIDGPPGEYPMLVEGEHAQDVLLQGLIAAEFLKLYGDACEARGMGLRELFISCAWPLDNPEFGKLLQQLLLCCLLEQLNQEPPAKGRGKRWMRCLTDATWPEICRRYLLTSRTGKVASAPDEGSLSADIVAMEDDQAALHLARLLEAMPWHRLPAVALLRLTNILCYDIAQVGGGAG